MLVTRPTACSLYTRANRLRFNIGLLTRFTLFRSFNTSFSWKHLARHWLELLNVLGNFIFFRGLNVLGLKYIIFISLNLTLSGLIFYLIFGSVNLGSFWPAKVALGCYWVHLFPLNALSCNSQLDRWYLAIWVLLSWAERFILFFARWRTTTEFPRKGVII